MHPPFAVPVSIMVHDSVLGPYGGQNPPPNNGNSFLPAINPDLPVPPRVSMIVKKDNTNRWMDDNNGNWTSLISGDLAAESGRIPGWDMADNDVAIINASTLAVTYQSSLMNMVMGISVNPQSNRVVVVFRNSLSLLEALMKPVVWPGLRTLPVFH